MADLLPVDTEEFAMKRHIAAIGATSAIGIFDFGTRGVRLIVGPKTVPTEITATTFRMVGRKPNVGLDVEAGVLPLKARSLAIACGIIGKWRRLIAEEGVRDIHLISTAWFRWLVNKAEVSNFVRRKTGLLIEPIEHQREAELTLLSLPVLQERWRGLRRGPEIADQDTVALIDQGGGSLQVSWMRWGDRGKPEIRITPSRFPDLGTVARRRKFFTLRADGVTEVNPLDNAARIKQQIDRIADVARTDLIKDLELPTARSCAPGKLHVFAVGSAISDLGPDKVFERHNYSVDLGQIDKGLVKRLAQLDAERQQVQTVWRAMRLPAKKQTETSRPWFERRADLDNILTALFGLPVYSAALTQVDATKLTLCGYGLSYGYYFSKCLQKTPTVVGKAPDDSAGPYLFISYCSEDRQDVEAELDVLSAMRARFWLDKNELRGGEHFDKVIAHKIASSAGLIVFLTPNSVKRRWVKDEVAFAKDKNKLIIPIVLDKMVLPNEWGLRLAGIDQIQRFALEQDQYLTKLERTISGKCRRKAVS